jgi:hypothetical protein
MKGPDAKSNFYLPGFLDSEFVRRPSRQVAAIDAVTRISRLQWLICGGRYFLSSNESSAL